MRSLLFILIMTIHFPMSSQLHNLRNLYFNATNEEGIRQFHNEAAASGTEEPVIKAYRGVAEAMLAGISPGVWSKLSIFSRGRTMIDEAVKADWENPEIRFLRFSVQCKAPFILGYSGNLSDDAGIILQQLKSKKIDHHAEFWARCINFMLSSGQLSSTHAAELSQYRQ